MSALVLVADDDDDVRELLVFRLERAGYEVIAAADGEEALRMALDRRPAACVIDVMMPRLDGYEVVRRLRSAEAEGGRATAIFLLTASVHDAAVNRGLEVGADEYVTKPFSPAALAERIATRLSAG